jgi:hypothetical protein
MLIAYFGAWLTFPGRAFSDADVSALEDLVSETSGIDIDDSSTGSEMFGNDPDDSSIASVKVSGELSGADVVGSVFLILTLVGAGALLWFQAGSSREAAALILASGALALILTALEVIGMAGLRGGEELENWAPWLAAGASALLGWIGLGAVKSGVEWQHLKPR